MRRAAMVGAATRMGLMLGLGLMTAGAGAQTLPELSATGAITTALPAGGGAEVFGASSSADPVGPGDLLDVRIYGQPQLSGDLRVGPDGVIAPPFVASLAVGGKTPAAIQAELTAAYGGMLQHPMVSVRVLEVNSRRVTVNGEVPRPGVYAFSGQLTLLQAVGLAGGVDPVKASEKVYLLHAPPPAERTGAGGAPPTFTVNAALQTIDLSQIAQHPELNRMIEPGDVIDVPEAHLVYISGDVMHPGSARLMPGLTVTQLVSESGGLLPQAAPARVRILRLEGTSGARRELIVNVGAAQRNRGPDALLEADDIVLVPGSTLRMTGLEVMDFFTTTERWRVQQSVANDVP